MKRAKKILGLFIILALALPVCFATTWAAAKPSKLTIWAFHAPQVEEMKLAAPGVKKKFGVDIEVVLVPEKQFIAKYQAALLSGVDIPDLIEVGNWEYGNSFFKIKKESEIPLVDITSYLKRSKYWKDLVHGRLGPLTWKGKIYAIPHDIHPSTLVYYEPAWKAAGVDLSKVVTWDEFIEAGKKVTKDLDGDGKTDVYAFVGPRANWDVFEFMLQEKRIWYADEKDTRIMFTHPDFIEVVLQFKRLWDSGIVVSWDWGQNMTLFKAQKILSVAAPDWYVGQMRSALSDMTGWRAMPLPTFPGSKVRTGVWGGSAMAISKATKNPKLAFDIATYLYWDPEVMPKHWELTGILPPIKSLWSMPLFHEPDPWLGGQKFGELLMELAPDIPAIFNNNHTGGASGAMNNEFIPKLLRGEWKTVEEIKKALDAIEKDCYRKMELEGLR
ncbi:MAG: extracellular solute-binding protein [Firmicutes bacterium]|nr:extracellular solute-binding protein [Bacillota bacterium]